VEEALRLSIDSRPAEEGARRYARSLDEVRAKAGKAAQANDDLEARFRGLARSSSGARDAIRALGIALGTAYLVREIGRANEALDRFNDSVRRLGAASQTSGVSVGQFQRIATNAQRQFLLTGTEANNYAEAVGRLVERTDDLGRSQQALSAVMLISSRQGLAASDAIRLMEAALRGSDEATEALFAGAQPSEIFERYAASANKAAKDLTTAERAQAIFNVAIERAERLGGTYAGALTEIERAQRDANRELEAARVEFATAFAPSRVDLINAQADALSELARIARENGDAIRAMGDAFVYAVEKAGRLIQAIEWLDDREIHVQTVAGVPMARVIYSPEAGDVMDSGRNRPAGFARGAPDGGASPYRPGDLLGPQLRAMLEGRTPLTEEAQREAEKAAKDLARALKDVERGLIGLDPWDNRKILGTLPTERAPRYQGSDLLLQGARRERDRLRGFTGPLHLTKAKDEQDLARAFAEGARGLVDLADAAGALGDTSRRALSGLSGLIGGISGLKGQSGIGLAGGVLGLFGAGAQLISGLLGGNQGPSERERILEQNTDALSRLTLTMEGFRNTFDRQAAALTAARQIAGSEDARLGIAFGDKKRDREIVESFLAPLGLTFEQFSEIARQAGIELELASGNLNPDAFEQFAKALELARLNVQEFGATLEGQRKLADAYNEIFDITDPAKLLESQVGLLAKQAPGLFGGFGNLDFASAGDRALLEAALRDMVTRAMSGALTADDLGGFTSVDEFLQSILGIDRALDGFAEATNAATSAMLNVPRALPLELIRQGVYAGIAGRSGLGPGGPTDTGGNLPPGYGPVASRGAAWNIQGGVTVQVVSDGSETPEQLVRKIETGVQQRAASGQYTYLPNTRTDR
jgi:hypothetical protein